MVPITVACSLVKEMAGKVSREDVRVAVVSM